MKTICKLLLPLLLSAMLFASCRHSDAPLVFKLYEYEENPFADNEDTIGCLFSIKIQLPISENHTRKQVKAIDAMRNSLLLMVLQPWANITDSTISPETAIRQYCENYIAEAPFNQAEYDEVSRYMYQWEHRLNVMPELVGEEMVVYCINALGTEMGKNYNQVYYLLFDRHSGQILEESDIFLFTDENKQALTNLLRDKLKGIIEAEPDEEVRNEVIINNVAPNGNFQVKDESLVYHFDSYEIAPNLEGDIPITLLCYELEPYLNPKSVLYRYWFGKHAKH